MPKRILPKQFRNDPFADPPPITENDIQDGMFSLLNRGIIPKDVDLSPAFERGQAPFAYKTAQMQPKPQTKPPQLSKPVSSPVNKRQAALEQDKSKTPNAPPDSTFLTTVGLSPSKLQEHLDFNAKNQAQRISEMNKQRTKNESVKKPESKMSKSNNQVVSMDSQMAHEMSF